MLSLESISAVKVAVQICHFPKLKVKILRAHESENVVNKDKNSSVSKNVLMEIENTIRSLKISRNLQEKLVFLVSRIGKRMLEWADYHEKILEISRDCSVTLLTPSFFTQREILDRKKAAKQLMDAKTLDIKQQYILACVYCFSEDVTTLFEDMTDLNKGMFYDALTHENVKQLELVKYWTYYQMHKLDELTNEDLSTYKIKTALRSGSIAAVEYFVQEMILGWEMHAIVEAAMEAIRFWQRHTRDTTDSCAYLAATSDNIIIPRDYFADILWCLLSRLQRTHLIDFLKRDIEDLQYKTTHMKYKKYSRVLECLLDCPYQDYFMQTLSVMWEFLPEWNYAVLLLIISHKIELGNQELDSEGKSLDYRRILREFWCQSKEHHKQFVLNNEEIQFSNYSLKSGVRLLIRLFSLSHFTNEDKENIEIILANATDEQKENIMCSKQWGNICTNLLKEQKWGVFIRIDQDYFFTEKARGKFKKILSSSERVKLIILRFVQMGEWYTVESFIKWWSLPEQEIKKLKRDIIYSDRGMEACISRISFKGKLETDEKFITWWFSSEQDVKLFKKGLIFSRFGIDRCENLIIENKYELLNEFIHLFLSSSEDIKELKKKIAYHFGYTFCKVLISNYDVQYIKNNLNREYRKVIFTGGKWEEVEKFITFCFSSEDQINEFKENCVLKKVGREIHLDLIDACKWEEAETFFSWLGLSEDGVKKLKKETLFFHYSAKSMFIELMHSEEGYVRFAHYGTKDEAIELVLRWFLNDKDTVIEFRKEYEKWFENAGYTFKYKDLDIYSVLENFDLIIEQRF